jgi:hypothetical protein
MNDFDVTGTDFQNLTAVELRKFAAKAGVKGASKGKKADLIAALEVIEAAQLKAAVDAKAAAEAKPVEAPKVAKNLCPICGLRKKYSGAANGEVAPRLSDMCNPCYAEGGWENSHSDSNHDAILETPVADRTPEQLAEIEGCWICFPDLNLAKFTVRGARSRAGMVILAKGTEYHKSATFKAHAEAAGWTVTVAEERYEVEDDEEGMTRYFATATKGEHSISLAWDGRAYDYHASSARLAGKDRKVRNLKEATRLLVAY